MEPTDRNVVLFQLVREKKMSIDKNEWVSKRAYSLWEEAGRPDGRGSEHWLLACAEFDFMCKTRASSDGAEILRFRSRRPILLTRANSFNESDCLQPKSAGLR